MTRILKAFDAKPDALAAIDGVRTLQTYPAFTVVEAKDDAAAAAVLRTGLTEDITENYVLQSGERAIDTAIPRVDAQGVNLPHPAYRSQKPLPKGPHHYIVQFIGPVRRSWLGGVGRTGAEIVAPYQHYAVIAAATAKQAGAIGELDTVRWVGHLPYAARLSETTSMGLAELSKKTPRSRFLAGVFEVQFFKSAQAAKARRGIEKLGFEIVEDRSKQCVLVVHSKSKTAAALAKKIDALSKVHGVRYVGRKALNRISNDRAAVVMGTAAAMAMPKLGLSGAGEIVGICDTGLDNGIANTIHPDFAGRVAAIRSYPVAPSFDADATNVGADDGPADVDSGHGTHTSGSILGSGASSSNLPGLAGPVRGLAYGAKLVMQAVEQKVDWKPGHQPQDSGSPYALAGLPAELTDLFAWSYGKGARIHSNSWGGGLAQEYNSYSNDVDAFVWNNPDFCILFAAGNDGGDADGDGKIDGKSVTPPGTAKNCITVGACADDRPQITFTNGGLWGPTAAPAAALAAGDPSAMAPFSSRGPTKDGRFKPDVVAPGTFVLSTRSRQLAEKTWGYGRYGTSSLYMYDCGTSMATPLTAGAVALIREYLRTKKGIASPSAALLKASLIAGAVPITGDGGPPPDNAQGFGRVNVDAIVAPAAPLAATFVDGPKLATGDLNERTIQLTAQGHPLKVVMVYSDAAGANLVNNLNLVVRAPDGTVATGNDTLDKVNNVECVLVPNAAQGAWKIQVIASNVAQGPQAFALAILAASG